jgi:hypothetical protein
MRQSRLAAEWLRMDVVRVGRRERLASMAISKQPAPCISQGSTSMLLFDLV